MLIDGFMTLALQKSLDSPSSACAPQPADEVLSSFVSWSAFAAHEPGARLLYGDEGESRALRLRLQCSIDMGRHRLSCQHGRRRPSPEVLRKADLTQSGVMLSAHRLEADESAFEDDRLAIVRVQDHFSSDTPFRKNTPP